MKQKTTKILYWTLTILFSAFMLMDGVAGLLQVEAGKESMAALGYPFYLLTILGVAKVLGSLALLQNKFYILKEWAYAGFTINLIGATASWTFVDGPIFFIALPIIILLIMLYSYYLWEELMEPEKSHEF